MTPPRIEVHIETLELEGLPGLDAEALALALQAQLAVLVEKSELSPERLGQPSFAALDGLQAGSGRLDGPMTTSLAGTLAVALAARLTS